MTNSDDISAMIESGELVKVFDERLDRVGHSYYVSMSGKVVSLFDPASPKMLSPLVNASGYECLALFTGMKTVDTRIIDLVWSTFYREALPKPSDTNALLCTVSANRTDYAVSNIEWKDASSADEKSVATAAISAIANSKELVTPDALPDSRLHTLYERIRALEESLLPFALFQLQGLPFGDDQDIVIIENLNSHIPSRITKSDFERARLALRISYK